MTQVNKEVYEGPLDSTGIPVGFEPVVEPEFGPLRSGYKGISQEVEEVVPDPEQDPAVYVGPVDEEGIPLGFAQVENIEEVEKPVEKRMEPLYYRGAPLPSEVAKGAADDLEAFGRDVPRLFLRTTKNLTTMALNAFLPTELRDSINNLPEKQRNEVLNKVTEEALTHAFPLMGKLDWNNPETIDPETRRIRHTESDGAIAVDMGLFLYTGNKIGAVAGIAKAGVKNFPKLSALAQEIGLEQQA